MDTVNHALPKQSVLSRNALTRAIGFQNPRHLIKHINRLGQGNITIQNLYPGIEMITDAMTASLPKTKSNKQLSTPPKAYRDAWHTDIGYTPSTAIGGICYTLLLVDKHSRFKFLFGLKNLTTSLKEAINKFLTVCGPTQIIVCTDFDHKLMGGSTLQLLQQKQILVKSAPPRRQDQNVLVEWH